MKCLCASMLVALILFTGVVDAQNNLSNVNSSKGTKALYKYLNDLSASSNKEASVSKVLSGIYGLRFPGRTDIVGAEEIYNKLGVWPAIVGLEYCWSTGTSQALSSSQAMQWKTMNPQLIEHWEKGGIVKVITHFPNPSNEKFGGLSDANANFSAILTDGTPERKRWLSLLDEVALGIQDLDAHSISVIYSPLEELNSKSYWWGFGSDEDRAALWIDIHNYLTKTKKCNNIIWLFAPRADFDFGFLEKVIGFSDLVGLVIYSSPISACVDKYKLLEATGKPFLIGLFYPRVDNTYDCSKLLVDIKAYLPKTIGFMYSHSKNNPLTSKNAEGLFKNNLILNAVQVKYKGRL